MARHYAACDLTMLPTRGEGFGFPVIESMAAGTPCLTGSWGGQAELVPHACYVVTPERLVVEGANGLLWPIFDPEDWADQAEWILQAGKLSDELRAHAAGWDWASQWPKFHEWIKNINVAM
jgi:glycosyltransferase involved in cell wall biosynthesis